MEATKEYLEQRNDDIERLKVLNEISSDLITKLLKNQHIREAKHDRRS